MPSALWAGRRAKGRVPMTFGITLGRWARDIECGLPAPTEAALPYDPRIISEVLSLATSCRAPVAMLRRRGRSAMSRSNEGRQTNYPLELLATETALSSCQDPQQFPEFSVVVDEFRGWRFYHRFRTDPQSPLRMPQVGVWTPTISSDGSDLAATLHSVIAISDEYELHEAIEETFPGSHLKNFDVRRRLKAGLRIAEFKRALGASELSDGTLRYLWLVGALFRFRAPPLMVLNEPDPTGIRVSRVLSQISSAAPQSARSSWLSRIPTRARQTSKKTGISRRSSCAARTAKLSFPKQTTPTRQKTIERVSHSAIKPRRATTLPWVP